MNKFYFIFPALLVIAFGLYYTQVAKPEMAADEAAARQIIADKQAADDVRRAEIEKKATADAAAQQKAREEKEHEKQEKARLAQVENDSKIAEETARLESDAATLSKQIADMEKEIADLRSRRENLSREVFASAAKVELARIDRQNAELEIQRMYDMVAQKVGDSFLTKLPVAAPAK